MTGHTHRVRRVTVLAVGALSLAGLAACASSTDQTRSAPASVVATATGTATTLAPAVSRPASTLSRDEIAGLVWMREEEQLAHDVYVALGEQWSVRSFTNIAASETTHLEAVADLLDRYGIADPSADRPAGTFADPRLQALYDDLMLTGRTSLLDALQVGARIEEIDIVDLQAREAVTSHADILAVYANLEKGSRNHLRAFTSQLTARGVTYVPTSLSPASYDAIVAGAVERGPAS